MKANAMNVVLKVVNRLINAAISQAFFTWHEAVDVAFNEGNQQQELAKLDLHEKTLQSRDLEVMQLQEEIQVKDATYSALPVVVEVHMCLDYDSTFQDAGSTSAFNISLEKEVSIALGVAPSSVAVLCHQRGSIIAQVVVWVEKPVNGAMNAHGITGVRCKQSWDHVRSSVPRCKKVLGMPHINLRCC